MVTEKPTLLKCLKNYVQANQSQKLAVHRHLTVIEMCRSFVQPVPPQSCFQLSWRHLIDDLAVNDKADTSEVEDF
jgi:hypothetical protein